ncbi:hypothetical protein [Acidovorax sp. HMWF029]|uniref:hypothetical protein n=1 Tax=Acidovorax sp. HMWF029 TaxID=2056863 RepID=UPI0011B1F952|nr:hypothetical protein [Acidovorax sp. HMWF029]
MKLPGRMIDVKSSGRLHRIFLYKFFKGSHAYRKNSFDKATMSFSSKKTWKFNLSGPFLGGDSVCFVGDRSVLDEKFFEEEGEVCFFEAGRFDRKNPPKFYCVGAPEARIFLQEPKFMTTYSSDLLYVVGKKFNWFLHIRASLKFGANDDSDYIYNLYVRKSKLYSVGGLLDRKGRSSWVLV